MRQWPPPQVKSFEGPHLLEPRHVFAIFESFSLGCFHLQTEICLVVLGPSTRQGLLICMANFNNKAIQSAFYKTIQTERKRRRKKMMSIDWLSFIVFFCIPLSLFSPLFQYVIYPHCGFFFIHLLMFCECFGFHLFF